MSEWLVYTTSHRRFIGVKWHSEIRSVQ